MLKYLCKYIISPSVESPDQYFNNFSSSVTEPIIWQLLFCLISILIVIRGISKGIEKISKIFLPLLGCVYYFNCYKFNFSAKRR